MAKTGLDKWFNEEKWVDISAPKKNGSWVPCGGKSATKSKRGKPKCVPLATANNMTVKEIRSAVDRKRKAEKNKKRDGNKPINVKTFV